MHEYAANLHLHSTFSDGTYPVPDLVDAAREAGLDIIGLTDHRTLAAAEAGHEGWYGDSFLFVGTELNQNYNHYLAFGVEDEIPSRDDDPQWTVDAVARRDAAGFIAHPYDEGIPALRPLGFHKGIRWRDWSIRGMTGMGVWDYPFGWKRAAATATQAARALAAPDTVDVPPNPKALARWDALTRSGVTCVGIAETDNHGLALDTDHRRLEFFDLVTTFKTLNNHLLLPAPLTHDVAADKKAIVEAFRRGHLFMGYDLIAETRGFDFHCECTSAGAQRTWTQGDALAFRDNLILHARVPPATPERTFIRLIRDGREISQSDTGVLEYPVGAPGVYRTEVFLRCPLPGRRDRFHTWILSNPVYIRGG